MTTLRLQILDEIVKTFKAVDEDTYGLKFSIVEIGPLSEPDNRKAFCIGIVPMDETYRDLYPLKDRSLRIAVEFRVTVNQVKGSPGREAERVLGVIENVILRHKTWNGLAAQTDLVGNEINMDNFVDKTVDGVVLINVNYRHSVTDNESEMLEP